MVHHRKQKLICDCLDYFLLYQNNFHVLILLLDYWFMVQTIFYCKFILIQGHLKVYLTGFKGIKMFALTVWLPFII